MTPFAAPRRLIPTLMAAVCLLASAVQASEPSTAQRAAFRQAYAVAKQGGDSWRSLASGLRDYPLYPYLQAAALEHDIRQVDRATVEAYLRQYPDQMTASDLRRDFLRELARRKDWDNFLAMYRPGMGDSLSCDALQARLAHGAKLDFDKDLAPLWAKPSLPNACDPVLTAAHDQGLLTDSRLWTRIDRAIAVYKGGTVASLASWLPGEEAAAARRLAQALRDPAGAVAAAAQWPDTPRHRQAAALALARLARRQVGTADAAWRTLQQRFSFSTSQRNQVQEALALFHATDFDDDALARLAALPAAAQTDATREWRVRVALARQDWKAALAGIEAMPETQRQDSEWGYFHARALDQLGRHDEARSVYAALARHATYYGFLAADQLHQPYAICPLALTGDPQREQTLLEKPGLRRAFELFAVDLPRLARREWNRALNGADQATVRLAVDLANRHGWYDRAVFALSSGDALRIYRLRFPLASQDGLVPQAEQAGIDPAWAYGILRAESAWMTDAHSGADARGLMQLLPSTARLVAKRHGLSWGGGDTLYDPAVNIALGTRYLARMAGRYNGAPWLASAAYNAGPNRVDQWLAARSSLAPDLFVATIPFKETREYVARVMAFSLIYDWRLHDDVVPLSSRMSPIGQVYAPPDQATVRKPVICPAATVAQKPAAPARAGSAAAASR